MSLPGTTEVAPQLDRQLVLHRCNAPTAERCAQKLLDNDRGTHFFIDAAGKVVQLLDAARPVLTKGSVENPQIHVHLAAPPKRAVAFQPLEHRQLWRHLRESVEDSGTAPAGIQGFSYTHAQYESLVPLLVSITQAFPNVRPLFPVDSNQRPTVRALVAPSPAKHGHPVGQGAKGHPDGTG